MVSKIASNNTNMTVGYESITLQLRHMSVMVSHVMGNSTVVLTGCWGTTKKTSKLSITGPLWGKTTGDWTGVLPNHQLIASYRQFWLYMKRYIHRPKKVLGHSLLCGLHGNHQIWNAIFRQPNVVAWWKFAWVYQITSSLRKPCCLKYNRCNIHIFIT